MGYVILLWHSLSLPYNYFSKGCEVFCKFCELDTKLTVVLMRVRKANFGVDENVLSLKFGR